MKKKVKIIFSLLILFITFYLVILISKLNILPNKYYYLYLITSILLNLISIILITRKKKLLQILGVILGILIIIFSILGIRYSKITLNYLNKKFNNNINIRAYNVLVLKNKTYQNIEDLNNKTLGYLKDTPYVEEIKTNINKYEYDNINDLYNNLVNEKIESILVEKPYLDLLEEQDENIYDKIKIIYSFDIKEETKKTKDVKRLESINVLISGSDSRTEYIASNSRTDVNMIVTINPNTQTILLTSIPRDYYVTLHGTTGLKDKLTHSGIYGIDMTKQTLEDLFDIKIDYTVKVGFQSVIKIVDLIGGIDIESDMAFYSLCGDGGAQRVNVVKGMNHFNGSQALSYARERYAYESGDRHRILNQQQVIEAIMNKLIKDKSILLKYDEILNAFGDLYTTDISSSYIKLFIKKQLNDMKSWNIIKQSVDGTGTMAQTYSMPSMDLYVMIPDYDTVKQATLKINKIKQD